MFKSIEKLAANGFEGFLSIEELKNNINMLPKVPGVYVVIHTNPAEMDFVEKGTGGFFKGKDPNIPIKELKFNCVPSSYAIYIGKAGGSASAATLHKRIKQYLSFGAGKAVGHYGGRLIWQIKDQSEIAFAWKPITESEPRLIEQKMIREFESEFGCLPFANLVR